MNKIVRIYTISCPFTEKVKYVGQTISPLEIRLKQHLSAPTNKRMAVWFQSLNGEQPIIDLLEVVDICHADETEMYWISQLRAWGIDLFNVNKCFTKNVQISLCVPQWFVDRFNYYIDGRHYIDLETIIIRAAETGIEMMQEREDSPHKMKESEIIKNYYSTEDLPWNPFPFPMPIDDMPF